jgi:hypothetical protein
MRLANTLDKKYSSNMDVNSSREIIKGKIVENIFEEMFRASNQSTVLPLGYEHTTPILAQYQHLVKVQKVLENIRSAPDFALITQDKTQVYFVEVKYRQVFIKEEIHEIAKSLLTKWDPSYLFLATKEKFYFSPCNSIDINAGVMEELNERWIKADVHQEYFSLLHEFIK